MTSWSPRGRWISTPAVVAAAALCASVPVAGAATQKHALKHRSCTNLLPKVISANSITGLSTSLKVTQVKSGGYYYKPPAWTCAFTATNPPWPAVPGVTSKYVGAVFADYQSSKRQFAEIRAGDKEVGSTLLPSPQYVKVSTVHLGHGSTAFVETDDWWGYHQMTPGEYPGIPHYVYEINVLTRHNNILYLFFFNASLSKTVTLAKGILARYGWF